MGSSITILMYHEIKDGPSALYVAADNFRAQMLYLRDNGFNVITMTQAQALLAQGQIPAKTVVITFDDGYVSVFNNAWPILQALNFRATVYVISSFSGLYNYLTWDQIKIMQAGGIEIGSHTKTHPALTTVSSAQLTDEIAGSKQVLEEQLGVPIYSFCYPTGAFNQYTPQVVKGAGYTSAVTIVNRSATAQDDSFLIPRIRVSKSTSISSFAKIFN
ncbi:MAG: polysaccharide deacetylase family protein [Firmicutes bacterium]|nr:polysaccharide deacetylase family protein [Bacillota bacterium]